MPETIPPTAPFSVATQEIDGDEFQRILVGAFYESGVGGAAGGTVYTAGDAIGAGGRVDAIPVGVYVLRSVQGLVNNADMVVPGMTVALLPSWTSEAYSQPADGDAWAPPFDARSGHVALVKIATDDQASIAGLAVIGVAADRERRIVVAPRKADGTLAAEDTATLFCQIFTADGVIFGGAVAGASISLLLEYVSPLPTEL